MRTTVLRWAPLLWVGGCLPFLGHGNPDGSDDASVDLGATGTFGDLWERATTTLTVIDGATGGYEMKTVDGAQDVPWPEDGAPLEVFIQIVNDQLVSHVWQQGEPVYHRIHEPLLALDSETYLWAAGTQGSRSFSMSDGHLFEVAQDAVGDAMVLSQITYGAHQGDFPPSAWPTQVLDADLTEVQP